MRQRGAGYTSILPPSQSKYAKLTRNTFTARAKPKKSTLASRSVHRSPRPPSLVLHLPSPNRAAPRLGGHRVGGQRLKLSNHSFLPSQPAGIPRQSCRLPPRDDRLAGDHLRAREMDTLALPYTTSHQIPRKIYRVARRGGGLV